MKVQFSCECGKKFSAEKKLAGKAIRCKDCGALVEIPAQTKPTVIRAVAVEPNFDELELPDIPDVPSPSATSDGDLNQVPIGYAPVSPQAYSPVVVSRSKARKKSSSPSSISPMAVIGILVAIVASLGVLSIAVVAISRMDFSKASAATNTDGLSVTVHPDENSRSIRQEEAFSVGQRFATAVQQRDVNTCRFLFDTDRLFEKAVSDMGLSRRFHNAMVKGFKDRGANRSIFNELIQAASSGTYEVVNSVTRDGEQRVVCRLITRDGLLNYHEFMFFRDEDGAVKIRDMFIFQTGESFGTSLRNIALLGSAVEDSSLWERLSGSGAVIAKNAKQIKAIYDTLKVNPTEALNMIRGLPPEVRDNRAIVLLELRAAGGSDQVALGEVLDKMQEQNPSDPSLSLQRLLLHDLRNETAQVIQQARKLSDYVGGDPFLEEMIDGLRK